MWVNQLGLKDTSSITKIVQGSRHPGAAITEALIKHFRFNSKDAQYFRDLVHLHKIKQDPRLSVLLLEKMGKQFPNAALRILDDKAFAIISNWYCTAIREMVKLNEFFEDPEWISKKLYFKVTPKEAKQAMDLLLAAELLSRDAQGRLKVTQGRFKTQNDYASEAIKRYHESMLENAKQAIRLIAVEDREFSASVITMNAANILKAKELIREFKDQFAQLMEEESGDGTYQIQLQFFPLTRPQAASQGAVLKVGELKSE